MTRPYYRVLRQITNYPLLCDKLLKKCVAMWSTPNGGTSQNDRETNFSLFFLKRPHLKMFRNFSTTVLRFVQNHTLYHKWPKSIYIKRRSVPFSNRFVNDNAVNINVRHFHVLPKEGGTSFILSAWVMVLYFPSLPLNGWS